MSRVPITRYVKIQAVEHDGELIPIWDERINFKNDANQGRIIIENQVYTNILECIYDLKKQQILKRIELDYYPVSYFQIGESVYYECSYKKIEETSIANIVYNDYLLCINTGRELLKSDYWQQRNIEIDKNLIYAVKNWKPTYILENGKIEESDYKLYKKQI